MAVWSGGCSSYDLSFDDFFPLHIEQSGAVLAVRPCAQLARQSRCPGRQPEGPALRMSKPLGQARHHQDLFGLHGGAPVRSIKPLRQKAKAPAALCLIPQHGGTPRCVPVLIGRSGNAPVSSYQLRGLPSMKIGSATRAILAARTEFRTSFDMVEGTYFPPAALPSGI